MSTNLNPIVTKGFLPLLAAAFLGVGCSGRLVAQNPQNIGKDNPDQAPVAVEKDQPPKESKVDKIVVPKTKLDEISFQQLTTELTKMTERFGKIDYQNRSYSFDSKAALDAGYDPELIKLAEEMVDWQTQRGQDSKRGVSIFGNPDYTPSSEKHPRLIRLMQRMTENAKINKEKAVSGKKSPKASEPLDVLLAANTADACGTYEYPKPNVTPPSAYYNMSNSSGWLTSNGYHLTSQYATYYGTYGSSYTKQTYYTGVQGTCDFPKFRFEGKTTTGTKDGYYYNMIIQGAHYSSYSQTEPNPEIWDSYYGYHPYLGWDTYVAWWHNRY